MQKRERRKRETLGEKKASRFIPLELPLSFFFAHQRVTASRSVHAGVVKTRKRCQEAGALGRESMGRGRMRGGGAAALDSSPTSFFFSTSPLLSLLLLERAPLLLALPHKRAWPLSLLSLSLNQVMNSRSSFDTFLRAAKRRNGFALSRPHLSLHPEKRAAALFLLSSSCYCCWLSHSLLLLAAPSSSPPHSWSRAARAAARRGPGQAGASASS